MQLAQEWWVVAPQFPEYEVSSLGRVRRVVATPRSPAGTLLKPSTTKRGYLQVGLYAEQPRLQPKCVRLNRLVCEAFHGQPPTPKHQAAHRDGDLKNNGEANLYWATGVENRADMDRHGRLPRGSVHYRSELDDDSVRAIRIRRATGETDAAIAADFGVTPAAIYLAGTRRNWKHVA